MANKEFLTLEEAAKWATEYRGRKTSPHNISYLINYARIHTFDDAGNPRTSINGDTRVSLSELKNYYDSYSVEKQWKKVLGDHINWALSFDKITEAERTKHVHRLHPYKGKFIPHLVKYFLDEHINDFKKEVFFQKGDIILDPFVGSGTTLVECLELGIHSIGIDISKFNCLISEVKTRKYALDQTAKVLLNAANATAKFSWSRLNSIQENELNERISIANKTFYPNPQFKFVIYRLREFQKLIAEELEKASKLDGEKINNPVEVYLDKHFEEKRAIEEEISSLTNCLGFSFKLEIRPSNIFHIADEFSTKYAEQVLKSLHLQVPQLEQTTLAIPKSAIEERKFLSRWFTNRQRTEMQFYMRFIEKERNPQIQDLMKIVLSRTIRSCRATTHSDLATLTEPQSSPYYCPKHYKICKPVTTIVNHLKRYTEDTIARIAQFEKLRKNVFCKVINADSRSLDILDYMKENNKEFFNLLVKRQIDGVFTSPPYVGQIDYHEQHAYAYELFDIERKDAQEIGQKAGGTGKLAQAKYITEISEVLTNIKRFLKKDAFIFIVANDSRNLFKTIAKKSGLHIENIFHRPVLDRTERDKQPYSESIFQMRTYD